MIFTENRSPSRMNELEKETKSQSRSQVQPLKQQHQQPNESSQPSENCLPLDEVEVRDDSTSTTQKEHPEIPCISSFSQVGKNTFYTRKIATPSKLTSKLFSGSIPSNLPSVPKNSSNFAKNKHPDHRESASSNKMPCSEYWGAQQKSLQTANNQVEATGPVHGNMSTSQDPPSPSVAKPLSPPEGERILMPHANDILCGRGGSINAHPGNRVFRAWVQDRKASYNLAHTKAEKSRVVNEIMQMIQALNPPGKFLQKVVPENHVASDEYDDGGWWEVIDNVKAMAKVSQALREGAPAFRAAHGKGRGKKAQNVSQRKASTKGKPSTASATTKKQTKSKNVGQKVSSGSKRAAPRRPSVEKPKSRRRSSKAGKIPESEVSPNHNNQHEYESTMPPISDHVHEIASMQLDPHLEAGELDRLFSPNSSNHFGHVNDSSNHIPSMTGLNPHPLVPLGDYHASMADVAGAIPPTPPSIQKPKVKTTVKTETPGNVITPHLLPSSATPPPVSPYGGRDLSHFASPNRWDNLAFLSPLTPKLAGLGAFNKGPNENSQNTQTIGRDQHAEDIKESYLLRGHSLSLSDPNDVHGADTHSVEEFANPFENEDEMLRRANQGGEVADIPGHSHQADQKHQGFLSQMPESSEPRLPFHSFSGSNGGNKQQSEFHPNTGNASPDSHLTSFPPPSPRGGLMPRGLSFGRIGNVPVGHFLRAKDSRESSMSLGRKSSCDSGKNARQDRKPIGGARRGNDTHSGGNSNSKEKEDTQSKGSESLLGHQQELCRDERSRSFISDFSDIQDMKSGTENIEHVNRQIFDVIPFDVCADVDNKCSAYSGTVVGGSNLISPVLSRKMALSDSPVKQATRAQNGVLTNVSPKDFV